MPDFAQEIVENDPAQHAKIRASFAQLNAAARDVLTLCVIEEMPLSKAAAVLAVPVGTVKSRLSRAKKRLAEIYLDSIQLATATEGQG